MATGPSQTNTYNGNSSRPGQSYQQNRQQAPSTATSARKEPPAVEDKKGFDPRDHLMPLKQGNTIQDYLPVAWRISWFRHEYPHGTIETSIILIDPDKLIEKEVSVWNNETRRSDKIMKHAKGIAIVQATIHDGEHGSATGIGSETAVDFADYIEKAETKAVGRALGMLGYGTQFAPEFQEGEVRLADSPVARPDSSPPVPVPALALATPVQQQQQQQQQATVSETIVAPIVSPSPKPAVVVPVSHPAETDAKTTRMSEEQQRQVASLHLSLSAIPGQWERFVETYMPKEDFPALFSQWTSAHATSFLSHYQHWVREGQAEWRRDIESRIQTLLRKKDGPVTRFPTVSVRVFKSRLALPGQAQMADMHLKHVVLMLQALEEAEFIFGIKPLVDDKGVLLAADPYHAKDVLDLWYRHLDENTHLPLPETIGDEHALRTQYTEALVRLIAEKKLNGKVPNEFQMQFHTIRRKLGL